MPRNQKRNYRRYRKKNPNYAKNKKIARRGVDGEIKGIFVDYPGGFPPSYTTRMLSAITTSFTGTTGAIASQSYYMNSCFDPFGTNGSVRPVGFDIFCNATGPYTSYMVYKSQLRIQIVNTSTTVPLQYVMLMSQDAGVLTDIDDAKCQSGAVFGTLQSEGSGGSKTNKVIRASSKDVIGYGERQNQIASSGANPARLWYVHVLVQALDGAATATALVSSEVMQWVRFSQTYELIHG